MIGGYRTFASVAGGFLLAALVIAGASLSGVTQQTSSANTKAGAAGTMAAATRGANQSSSLSSNNLTGPGRSPPVNANGTSSRPATPSQSSLSVISKANGYSLLLTLTPLIAAVILGMIVYQLSARRTERTG